MASDGELDEGKLIYDWNSVEKVASLSPKRQIRFFCETLRDGIQSPSVRDPDIADKIKLVEIADSLGVHHIDIGLPGAGKRAVEDCTTLAEFIRDNKLAIKPACAARTHEADVGAIVDISQRVGIEIEVMAFIGSSPIRAYAESWDLERMLALMVGLLIPGMMFPALIVLATLGVFTVVQRGFTALSRA